MKNSRIEWTDHTFNPWIGCTEISTGCRDCYARRDFEERKHLVTWGQGEPRHRTSPANWRQPYRLNAEAKRTGTRPLMFCASLADVFDKEVKDAWRTDLFDVIDDCRQLHWLILTKRPKHAREYLTRWEEFGWPWAHVWLGVSVENDDAGLARIPELIETPAAGHFISYEPLLGPVNYEIVVDWVIAGGESGSKARPMHPAWVRGLRDQCQATDTPFFFKSWGEWASLSEWPGSRLEPHVFEDGLVMHRVGKRRSGAILDGREWLEVPPCLV